MSGFLPFRRPSRASIFFMVAEALCVPFLAAQDKVVPVPDDPSVTQTETNAGCHPELNYVQFANGIGTKTNYTVFNPGETLHMECSMRSDKLLFGVTSAIVNANNSSLWRGKSLGMEEASVTYKSYNWGFTTGLQAFNQTAAAIDTVANHFFPGGNRPTLIAQTESFSTAITDLVGMTAWNKTNVDGGSLTTTGTIGYELNRHSGSASYAADMTYAVEGKWSVGAQFDIRPNGASFESRSGGHAEWTGTYGNHKIDVIAESSLISNRVGYRPGNQWSGTVAALHEQKISSTFHWYQAISLGGNTARGGFTGIETGVTISPARHVGVTAGIGLAAAIEGGPRGPSAEFGLHLR